MENNSKGDKTMENNLQLVKAKKVVEKVVAIDIMENILNDFLEFLKENVDEKASILEDELIILCKEHVFNFYIKPQDIKKNTVYLGLYFRISTLPNNSAMFALWIRDFVSDMKKVHRINLIFQIGDYFWFDKEFNVYYGAEAKEKYEQHLFDEAAEIIHKNNCNRCYLENVKGYEC